MGNTKKRLPMQMGVSICTTKYVAMTEANGVVIILGEDCKACKLFEPEDMA